jgi:hypothetical protein
MLKKSIKNTKFDKKYKHLNFIWASGRPGLIGCQATKPHTNRLTGCVLYLRLATSPSASTTRHVVLVGPGYDLVKMT